MHLLTGQDARDYYAFCQRVDAFIKKRRLLVARRLFDGLTLYSNETHQGLASMNDMVLGTYLVREEEETTIENHEGFKQVYDVRWGLIGSNSAVMVLQAFYYHEDLETIVIGYVYPPDGKSITNNLVDGIEL